VLRDRAALGNLVQAGATVTGILASQHRELGDGVEHAAAVMETLADRRREVGDIIERAPAVTDAGRRTLAGIDGLLPDLDAVLRGTPPLLKPLDKLLRKTTPLAANAKPAIAQIRTLLTQSTAALRPLPRLDRAASPALKSTGAALKGVLPIVRGLRAYTPDVIGGFFSGFGGTTAGYYDANGHYLRISLQGSASSLPGILPKFPDGSIPVFSGLRTGITARCPGGAEEAAPDGSNPWQPPDLPSVCDPKDDPK
jgi:phospholipid/cholesterol/gamma-HCH transport system substrate-binding protein